MAVLRNYESDEMKERAKWEQRPSEYTMGGLKVGRPYVYVEYPKMLYLARRLPGSGKWACSQEAPLNYGYRDQNEWDRACQQALAFTTSCQKIVGSDREREQAEKEGWRETAPLAIQHALEVERAEGDEAAARNYRDRNMSDAAKAESLKAEEEHFGHLPSIPEKPVVKRRPYKRRKPRAEPAA